MKCKNCGMDNPDTLNFCGNCGTRLRDGSAGSKPSWGFAQAPEWPEPDFDADDYQLEQDPFDDSDATDADFFQGSKAYEEEYRQPGRKSSYDNSNRDRSSAEKPPARKAHEPVATYNSDMVYAESIDVETESGQGYDDYYEFQAPKKPKKANVHNNRPKKRGVNKSTIILIAAAVIAVLAIVFLVMVLVGGDGNGDNPEKTNKNVVIEPNPNDANCYYVKVTAAEGSILVYETNRGDQSKATVSAKGYVTFNVPVSTLMPVDPVDGATYQAAPKVYLQKADGTLEPFENMPTINLTVPALNVSYTTPDSITTDNGQVTIAGSITEISAELTINGEPVSIAEDGTFSHTVTFDSEGSVTVTAEAKLGGYQIARKEFTVTVNATVDPSTLIQISEGFSTRVVSTVDTITVTGSVPAGSAINVSHNESGLSIAQEPSVTPEGQFTFAVKMENPGDYALDINATLADGTVVTKTLHVQRAPAYSEYKQNAWAMNYDDMVNKAGSNQGFKISGTITEILKDDDYIIAKMQLTSGEEVLIEYHNHYSSAGVIEEGRAYTQIYGRPTAVNSDNILEIYVWFVDG